MDKLLVSVEEAAELLDVGRSTIYDLMRTGELPSVRIGRCRRLPVTGLQAYFAKQEADGWVVGPTSHELRRGA